MRDLINSQGNERRDDVNTELSIYFKYRDEVLALIPVNTEEKAVKYREILKRYYGVDAEKLIKNC